MWCREVIFLSILFMFFTQVAFAEPAFAGNSSQTVRIFVDDLEYEITPAAVLRDGKTMVPLRSFFELMEAKVDWCQESRIALAYVVGDKVVDYVEVDLHEEDIVDVQALIIDGCIFIHIAEAAGSLGYGAAWDSDNYAVQLKGSEYNGAIPSFLRVEVAKAEIENPSVVTGNFIWPVAGGRVISNYGSRGGRLHTGVDIGASKGTSVLASDGGVVIFSGWESGYGNSIVIHHGYFYTRYAHNSVNLVSKYQTVEQGQIIARIGSTGRATAPHLHFEIRTMGMRGPTYNPMNYLSFY